MRVKEVMSCDVVVASLPSSYKELAEVMLRHDVSGLPVVEEDGTLVVIVTEDDLIRRQGFAHSSPHRGDRFLTHLLADAEPYVVRRCEGLTAGDLMDFGAHRCMLSTPRSFLRVALTCYRRRFRSICRHH